MTFLAFLGGGLNWGEDEDSRVKVFAYSQTRGVVCEA